MVVLKSQIICLHMLIIVHLSCLKVNTSSLKTNHLGAGDLVDAVVPYMGESITDGTLATFLKSMQFFPLPLHVCLSFLICF